MLNSAILDVAIGLAFTYLLLALICTTINEWIANAMKTRAKMLEQGLRGMFGAQQTAAGANFLAQFQGHSFIKGLEQKPGLKPSYISSRTFALTVMDLITPPGPITVAGLNASIAALPAGDVRTTLLAVTQTAASLPEAQKAIEDWFNDTMNRVSGWYTRKKQMITVMLAIGVTLFVNADSLNIANKLWLNPTLRQQILERAQAGNSEIKKLMSATYPDPKDPKKAQVSDPANPSLATVEQLNAQLGDLTGWEQELKDNGGHIWKLLANSWRHLPGWALTIVAVSLGAPFWFDLLSKFMSIRGTGKKEGEAK